MSIISCFPTKGELAKLTGTQAQIVGFTADNVVGAVDAPAGTMIVNITGTELSCTTDKTSDEIKAAVADGYWVFANVFGKYLIPLTSLEAYGMFSAVIGTNFSVRVAYRGQNTVEYMAMTLPVNASDMNFSNSGTSLTSWNVQDAIEEVNGKIPSAPKSVTVTLPASGWSSNTQTVTVNGVLADESAQLIQPMPAVASQNAYITAGVICSGQAANQLSFTCSTTPTEDISLYVVLTEVQS